MKLSSPPKTPSIGLIVLYLRRWSPITSHPSIWAIPSPISTPSTMTTSLRCSTLTWKREQGREFSQAVQLSERSSEPDSRKKVLSTSAGSIYIYIQALFLLLQCNCNSNWIDDLHPEYVYFADCQDRTGFVRGNDEWDCPNHGERTHTDQFIRFVWRVS